jgi:catechol 2,3-dioxygenase-like lactoylglutathione lyase family enzyme
MRHVGVWGLWAAVIGLALGPAPVRAEGAGHVTGIGGVFIKSRDPKALAAWYRDMLGVSMEPWGGAMFSDHAPGHPPVTVWTALPASSAYMAPSSREFMLDLAVDDLDAIVARLKAKGVVILKRADGDANGRFAWIMDPDGTKIELWQPKPK